MRFLRGILKFLWPLLMLTYSLMIVYFIGNVADEKSAWYCHILQITMCAAGILLSFWVFQKLGGIVFPSSKNYKIGSISLKLAILLIAFAFSLFVLEQSFMSFLYFRLGGSYRIPVDLETISEILILSITSVFFDPILEEILFRYMALSIYKTTVGKILALVLFSLIFGLLHRHSWYSAATAFFDSILWGSIFLIKKQLIIPVTLHISHNAAVSIFGILYLTGNWGGEMNDAPAIFIFNPIWIVAAIIAISIAMFTIHSRKKQQCF